MICTFYDHSRLPMADGHRFRPAAFTCAAPPDFRMGDVLDVWATRGGRRVHVRLTVTDRGRLGRGHLDLAPAPFRALAGRGWRKAGVVRQVHCRLIGHRRLLRQGRGGRR